MNICGKIVEGFVLFSLSFLPAPEQVDTVVRPYAQTAAALATVTVSSVQLLNRDKKK